MKTEEVNEYLGTSLNEVLESMFYLSADGEVESPAEIPEDWMMRQLHFSGPANGWFGIGAEAPTARLIASNFLGQEPEELSDEQVGDILGEVANMVCGSVLGHSASKQAFTLSAPRAMERTGDSSLPAHPAYKAFSFEGSVLVAWMRTVEG